MYRSFDLKQYKNPTYIVVLHFFLKKNLLNCKKSITFVASIQMKTVKTLHFDAINYLYISV